jgi:hypothetical protein
MLSVGFAHARRPVMPMGNPIADDIRFDGECKARFASLILISLSILSSRSVHEQLQIGWVTPEMVFRHARSSNAGLNVSERRAVAHCAQFASPHATVPWTADGVRDRRSTRGCRLATS